MGGKKTSQESSHTLNEIARVFEAPYTNENINTGKKEKEETKEVCEDDINCLISIHKEIETDLIELIANRELRESSEDRQTVLNGIDKNNIHLQSFSSNAHHDISSRYGPNSFRGSTLCLPNFNLNNHRTVIDVDTQTSPLSVSPSSTNLSWASNSLSSPCLSSSSTSKCDSDCLDDLSDIAVAVVPKSSDKKTVLGSKFSSTPVLKTRHAKVSKQIRSQSDRHLTEIEAAEACKWLRATGFPQYAQLYEDNQFPIELATVSQDHPLLESDILHSLFRRLQILNSCAHLHQQKIDNTDESEDEGCALSDNWTYQSDIKRWSRNCYKTKAQTCYQDVSDKTASPHTTNEKKINENREVQGERNNANKQEEENIASEKNHILDELSQISNVKLSETQHSSDSETNFRTSRRSRTQSLDKTDSWSTTNIKLNRILWQTVPVQQLLLPEDKSDITIEIEGPPTYHLCASQLHVLRKLALLKLTAHMEKYCPAHRTGWNWDLPKFLRKIKSPIYKDRNVFGVPLSVIFQRTGKILPSPIEDTMHWLRENAYDQVGVFRKSGVKSRIQILRNKIELKSVINYTEEQCYDVADMLKQYFRELPDSLLTAKLSETFVLIFQYIPVFLRLESVICAMLLMPEENAQVLQALLHFLLVIASYSELNQMNEHNLAMCLAPTLFHSTCVYKPHLVGSPHPQDLAENKAAQECLYFFLKYYKNLFKVPNEFINQCNSSEIKEIKPKLLTDILNGIGGWKEYLKECQRNLLKEVKEKSRGWVPIPVQTSTQSTCQNSKLSIFYKKVADGMPLRLWKVLTELEAPPMEVAHRILRERHIWDYDLVSAKIIAQLDNQTEIFQFIRKSLAPIPDEEYCVIRTWKSDLPRDSCTIVETSVEYPGTVAVPNTTRGIVLASRYLIQPCGSGKSRIIHFSRVDTMGKSPQWYQKNYGYLSAVFLRHLQNSFYQNTNGPESQV